MTTLPRHTKWRDSVPPCPSAGALQYWTNPPRCRMREILNDGKRHQCHKDPGHSDKHACPCGREWNEK
jgi:hypothetical protein